MTLDRIPKRFRTPGHVIYTDGGSMFFGDKKLYDRISRRAKRTGADITEDFDDLVVVSDWFGSDLNGPEMRWVGNLIKAALRKVV